MDLYDRLPRKSIISEVNEIFYDKLYDHEWLSRYFQDIPKEHIRQQQTDFIVGVIGGPKLYCGRPAKSAHGHIFITDEMFKLRSSMLEEALDEAGAPEELKERWLRIDEGFRRGMVKDSVGECQKRFFTDEIKDFSRPMSLAGERR